MVSLAQRHGSPYEHDADGRLLLQQDLAPYAGTSCPTAHGNVRVFEMAYAGSQ
jgi:hypothetical protein